MENGFIKGKKTMDKEENYGKDMGKEENHGTYREKTMEYTIAAQSPNPLVYSTTKCLSNRRGAEAPLGHLEYSYYGLTVPIRQLFPSPGRPLAPRLSRFGVQG